MKRYNRTAILVLMICALCSTAFLTGCTPELKEYRSEAANVPTDGSNTKEGLESQSFDSFEMLTADPIEIPTAEEYYSANSEIVDRIDVANSDTVHTEAEAIAFLEARGFTQYPVSSDFTIDGKVEEISEVSSDSQSRHPVYTTYYLSETGNLWTIIDMNGRIFANPVFYNLFSAHEPQVYLSETDSLISYDGVDNRYYETKPNGDSVSVKRVERIDAETLNRLTEEEIYK